MLYMREMAEYIKRQSLQSDGFISSVFLYFLLLISMLACIVTENMRLRTLILMNMETAQEYFEQEAYVIHDLKKRIRCDEELSGYAVCAEGIAYSVFVSDYRLTVIIEGMREEKLYLEVDFEKKMIDSFQKERRTPEVY